jgi:protein ImuB
MGSNAPSPDKPLVLAGQDGNRRVVAAADRAAQMLGIRSGLALSQAQARVPDLRIEVADPEADEAALYRMALWALRRYSPVVAIDPPDGFFIDITGAAHLFGGERELLTDLASRLAKGGIRARTGTAETIGAAHALARFGPTTPAVAQQGEANSAVSALPVTALRLDQTLVGRLQKLGFETIADIAAAPRASLALRFGSEPGRRLDQIFGRVAEPMQPIYPTDLIFTRRTFVAAIRTAEAIARAIAELVGELCSLLEARGLGARRLDLVFHLVDSTIQAIHVGLAKPSRDIKGITRLLSDRIETIDPGFGIELMGLAAPIVEACAFRQFDSMGQNDQPDIADAIDVLANRLGADRLYRLTPTESEMPERSVKRLSPLAPPTGATWPTHWPRPSRLLEWPEIVETIALLPDQPPVHFVWRGVRRRVKRADGPERVFGEWWDRSAEAMSVRDYFIVEDETGQQWWLYRSGDGEDRKTGDFRWYLHGIFA